MLAGTRNEEMDSIGQISYKQLKNRFRQIQYRPKFVLGCEFDQQLLYDCSTSEQTLSEPIAAVTIDSSKIKEKFEMSNRKKRESSRFSDINMGD